LWIKCIPKGKSPDVLWCQLKMSNKWRLWAERGEEIMTASTQGIAKVHKIAFATAK